MRITNRVTIPMERRRERENRFLSFYLANPPLRETEGPANHPRYRGPVVQKPEIARYTVIAVAAQTRRPGIIYGSARCVTSCSPYDLIGFNYSPLKVTAAA